MKKLFAKSDVNGVKQSLIASLIFLVLLEPMIQIGKNLSKGIIGALMDYFYLSCSRVNNASFVSHIVFLAFAFYMIRDFREFIKLYQGVFSTNKKKEHQHSNDEIKTAEGRELDKIVETAIEIEKKNRKSKRLEVALKVVSTFMIILYVIFFLYILIYWYMPATMHAAFDREIIQLAPYVESEEIDSLKSDWVSMTSKNDYELIVKEIYSIAIESGLK